jgi:molybdopterin-guanine dinucleotide biosynthesis protein A
MTDWGAIVLAGGAGRRLGGVDKAGVVLGGRTLLDRALAAVAGAAHVVVVGPERAADGVVWTREDPPGGGPVAGLAAGLAAVADVDFVAVLAVDQPGVTASTVDRLRAAVGAASGAVLVDDGHLQWLAGVWRTSVLRAAMPAEPAGVSLRSVLRPLVPAEVPARPGEADDVDTRADLATLHKRHTGDQVD